MIDAETEALFRQWEAEGFAGPDGEVRRRHVEARCRHAASGQSSPNHRTFRPDIVIRGNVIPYTGYGQYIEWLMRALEAKNYSVRLASDTRDDRFIETSKWIRDRTDHRLAADWELMIGTPSHHLLDDRRNVWSTMWESTYLGSDVVKKLNSVELVIVPSAWVRDIFARNGVHADRIEVVPLGVDLAVFQPVPRSESGIFRFGSSGRRSHGGVRKGHEDVIAAFRSEFRTEADVALSLKLWPDCLAAVPALEVPDDPRIEVDTTPLPIQGLADWYRRNDVYVSGSRGEGFGLQPLASMACGVPVIATGCTGDSEYFTEDVGWRLRWNMEPGIGEYTGRGHLARPTIDSLRSRMREAYEDRDSRTRKGRAAIARAREFSWWWTGERMAEVLTERGFLEPRDAIHPSARRIFQMQNCPHLVKRSCGCENARCVLNKGRNGAEITGQECFACLEGQESKP